MSASGVFWLFVTHEVPNYSFKTHYDRKTLFLIKKAKARLFKNFNNYFFCSEHRCRRQTFFIMLSLHLISLISCLLYYWQYFPCKSYNSYESLLITKINVKNHLWNNVMIGKLSCKYQKSDKNANVWTWLIRKFRIFIHENGLKVMCYQSEIRSLFF